MKYTYNGYEFTQSETFRHKCSRIYHFPLTMLFESIMSIYDCSNRYKVLMSNMYSVIVIYIYCICHSITCIIYNRTICSKRLYKIFIPNDRL